MVQKTFLVTRHPEKKKLLNVYEDNLRKKFENYWYRESSHTLVQELSGKQIPERWNEANVIVYDKVLINIISGF